MTARHRAMSRIQPNNFSSTNGFGVTLGKFAIAAVWEQAKNELSDGLRRVEYGTERCAVFGTGVRKGFQRVL